MRRPVYKVDAFTTVPLRGSPVGVVPFARSMTADQMLATARELGASETAFVLPSQVADFRLRFFTPAQELPFCGHAVVAALTVLEELGELSLSGDFARVHTETGAGVLPADLVRSGEGVRVDLTQAAPAFRPCSHPADHLLEVLGADTSDLRADLPLELGYTGLWHLLVPLGTPDALDGLLPDFRALAGLNRELGVLSTLVFAQEGERFHCRGFAPAAGVDEAPVTGTASGALGAYLLRHRAIRPSAPFEALQGEACGRPGMVRVIVHGTPGEPQEVVVGGHAVVSLRGELLLG